MSSGSPDQFALCDDGAWRVVGPFLSLRSCCQMRLLTTCAGRSPAYGGGLWPNREPHRRIFVNANHVPELVEVRFEGRCYITGRDLTHVVDSSQLLETDRVVSIDDLEVEADCCEDHCFLCDPFDFDASPDFYDVTIQGSEINPVLDDLPYDHLIVLRSTTILSIDTLRILSTASINGTFRVEKVSPLIFNSIYPLGNCGYRKEINDSGWSFEWWRGTNTSRDPDRATQGYIIEVDLVGPHSSGLWDRGMTFSIRPRASAAMHRRFAAHPDVYCDDSLTVDLEPYDTFGRFSLVGGGTAEIVPGWD